ncbi:MAG: hypothetical protein Q9162_003581 [Coniocarpon cinnabarinum]
MIAHQVPATISHELQYLLHTRHPLDDTDDSLALSVPSWRPVSAAQIPNEELTHYCAKRVLAPGHVNDPLDYYTLRVADELMPVLNAHAISKGRTPPTLAETLPKIYDYMIWPGRYDAHRRWRRRDTDDHLPVSVPSCAALFGLTDYTLETVSAHKAAETTHFATRFDNVLLNAALGGHLELVTRLHELGVKPQRHLDPDTIACAAWSGNTDIVRFLLEKEYNPEQIRRGTRFLLVAVYWATRAGQENVIDVLKAHWEEHGDEYEGVQRNPVDWTMVLFTAVRFNQLHLVKRALREGGEKAARAEGMAEDLTSGLSTTVEVAAEFGRVEMVRLLIEAGAVTVPAGKIDRAIQRAARHGHVKTVEALLDFGVDPEWPLTLSAGPISWVQAAAAEGEDAVVRLLIERGFDAAKDGLQAAQIAASKGYVTVVKVFLGAGVDAERVKVACREHGQMHVLNAIKEWQRGEGVTV